MNHIKHIVVLMLENRSTFTNFGDFPQVRHSIHDPSIHDWTCSDGDSHKKTKYYAKTITDPDFRFSSCLDNSCVKSAKMAQGKRFAEGFVKVLKHDLDEHGHENVGSKDAGQVMFCFKRGSMPITHTLAKEFMIADQYFASILGPTWSNRIMAVSGECRDIYETPMSFEQIPFDQLAKQNQTTIFNLLFKNQISFHVYYGDTPLTWLLQQNLEPEIMEQHHPMSKFYWDCEHGTLPAFSWIEPRYSHQGNSFHPPSSPLNGERLIGRIYNHLRKHPQIWDHCLLIVTHDETGGLGDPEKPYIAPEFKHLYVEAQAPATSQAPTIQATSTLLPVCLEVCQGYYPNEENPYNQKPKNPHWLHTYGFRVPTLLISPWFKPRSVDHTIYDHTSILKTVCERFGLDVNQLGPRTPLANSFWHLMQDQKHESCVPAIALPKHDPRHYSGLPYNWTRFEMDILSGINYTFYTLGLIENVLGMPVTWMKNSWASVIGKLHSWVRNPRFLKRVSAHGTRSHV